MPEMTTTHTVAITHTEPAAQTESATGTVPPAFYPQAPAADGWIKRPPKPPVVVLMQPEEKIIELPKPKTVRAVLQALGLRECTALVARDGELLTPDRAVAPGDQLLVRKVTSSG